MCWVLEGDHHIAHPLSVLPGSSPCHYRNRDLLWHMSGYWSHGLYWILVPQIQKEKHRLPALQGKRQKGVQSREPALPHTHFTFQSHGLPFLLLLH